MATLIDRGCGMIYDTILDVTWLADADYAQTSGYDADGKMDWASAVAWAEQLSHCGYNDWRLPSLEEWHSLIDTRNQNPALIDPNPFSNIIGHMPYWTRTEYIYGQNYTCIKQCSHKTYVVMLYSGTIHHQKKTELAFILPVRSTGNLENSFGYRTRQ